jgi:hypothetical protein
MTSLDHYQVHNNVCEDCGALVVDTTAHDRFHAIQNDVARALAILQVAHIAANNWSADRRNRSTQ